MHSVFQFDPNSRIAWIKNHNNNNKSKRLQWEQYSTARVGWTWKIHRYLCLSVCLRVCFFFFFFFFAFCNRSFTFSACYNFPNTSWLITKPLRLMRTKNNIKCDTLFLCSVLSVVEALKTHFVLHVLLCIPLLALASCRLFRWFFRLTTWLVVCACAGVGWLFGIPCARSRSSSLSAQHRRQAMWHAQTVEIFASTRERT